MVEIELSLKIEKIAQKLELRQSVIAQFLKLVAAKKKYTSRDLIRKLGLPQVHFYRLIAEFTDISEPRGKYVEIKKGLAEEVASYSKEALPEISKRDQKIIKETIKKYQRDRPKPDRNLDQFTATVATTVKRAVKLAKNGDLKGKSLAFLGDDDLVSVAVALTKQCKKITVFEIDDRISKLIEQISEENGLAIEIIKQDLRQALDKKHINKYDLVFTDPPYTKEGVNIFLNQAIRLIRKSFLGRIYLCYGNSDRAREREIEIQKLILNHGLIIKTKLGRFNKYYGAESIGSQSSLYILDWTPGIKIVKSDCEEIYTNE